MRFLIQLVSITDQYLRMVTSRKAKLIGATSKLHTKRKCFANIYCYNYSPVLNVFRVTAKRRLIILNAVVRSLITSLVLFN